MQEVYHFKLILDYKEFLIPSDFPSFDDVDPSIHTILLSKGQYIVKSNVSKLVFQSFLNHWVYNKTPNIHIDNIDDYYLLSQEFDRMKDLISMFKSLLPNTNCSYLQKKNQKLNSKREKKNYKLNKSDRKFHLIIDHIFNNDGIDSFEKFVETKLDLLDACMKEKERLVDLLTKKQLKHESGLLYIINEEEKTAGVFRIFLDKDTYLIPRTVKYNGDEYLVTVIHESAFSDKGISFITFDEDSELKIIEKNAFLRTELFKITIPQHVKYVGKRAFAQSGTIEEVKFTENSEIEIIESNVFDDSLITKFSIPSSVKILRKDWINNVSNLKNVTIYKNDEENVIFYDNKFLIEKSINSNDFDRLIFAIRSIKEAEIPPFIRVIGSFAFAECDKLKTVTFSEKSQLEIIESSAFSKSSIQNISIPDSVTEIGDNCFSDCEKLECVEFSKNSKLISISKNAFSLNKMSDGKVSIQLLNIMNPLRNIIDLDFDQNLHESNNYLPFLPFQTMNNNLLNLNPLNNFYNPVNLNPLNNFNSTINLNPLNSFNNPVNLNPLNNFNNPINLNPLNNFNDPINLNPLNNFNDPINLNPLNNFNNPINLNPLNNFNNPVNLNPLNNFSNFGSFNFTNNSNNEKSQPNTHKILPRQKSINSIKSISIPSSVVDLKDGWCSYTPNLTKINVIQTDTENIRLIECKIIVGKSDIYKDDFDVLLFAARDIKNVLIPTSIKRIASYAFANCCDIKKVEFSEDSELEIIEKYAFYGSSIESITIPPRVVEIEEAAFSDCKHLTDFNLSENSELKKIGKCCFSKTLIYEILIPSNVEKLGKQLFEEIPTLMNVSVMPNNKNFSLLNENFLVGKSDKFSEIYDTIYYAKHDLEEVIIPSFIKRICQGVFSNFKQLTKIEFSSQSELNSIDSFLFASSSIVEITIPPNVTRIGESAFFKCEQLKMVKFIDNSKLEIIENHAFYNCSKIEHIVIPKSVLKIEYNAFNGCKKLKTVEFEENCSLQFICPFAFFNSGIESVLIPSSVLKIDSDAFNKCGQLETVEFLNESNLKIIGDCSFSGSLIQKILIPPNVFKIDSFAFYRCKKLKKIKFHEDCGLKIINKFAFSGTSIHKIVIPPTVTLIGRSAFADCTRLKKVEFTENSNLQFIGEDFQKLKVFQSHQISVEFKMEFFLVLNI